MMMMMISKNVMILIRTRERLEAWDEALRGMHEMSRGGILIMMMMMMMMMIVIITMMMIMMMMLQIRTVEVNLVTN